MLLTSYNTKQVSQDNLISTNTAKRNNVDQDALFYTKTAVDTSQAAQDTPIS